MSKVRSGVVEITLRSDGRLDSQEPCKIVHEFLSTQQTESVDYRTPEDRLTDPFIKIERGEKRGVYHAFVQIKLKNGDFGGYIDGLRVRALSPNNGVASAAWRKSKSLVSGGVARLGEVCHYGKAL